MLGRRFWSTYNEDWFVFPLRNHWPHACSKGPRGPPAQGWAFAKSFGGMLRRRIDSPAGAAPMSRPPQRQKGSVSRRAMASRFCRSPSRSRRIITFAYAVLGFLRQHLFAEQSGVCLQGGSSFQQLLINRINAAVRTTPSRGRKEYWNQEENHKIGIVKTL